MIDDSEIPGVAHSRHENAGRLIIFYDGTAKPK